MAALVFHVQATGIFTIEVEEGDVYDSGYIEKALMDLLHNGFDPGYTKVDFDLIEARGNL